MAFLPDGDWLDRTAAINGLPTGAGERTAFFGVNYIQTSTFAGFGYGTGSGNQAFGLTGNGSGGLLTLQSWGSNNDLLSTETGTGAGWLIQSAVLQSNSDFVHYKDRAQIDAGNRTFNTTLTRIAIGEEIGGAGNGEEIDVAAALVYDRAPTENEHRQVEQHLQSKYLGAASACAVTSLSAGIQSPCDPQSNTFTQEVTVTFSDPPATGTLEVNGQSFPIGASPQTVTLTGLAADGQDVDVTAGFSGDPTCALTVNALFTAPPACPADGPVINVWYGDTQEFGNNGEPQVWCNIPGNVADGDGGSITSLEYTLNGGTPVALSIGPDNRRLENSGDFNVDIDVNDLNPGANTVEITALDNDNNLSSRTVTVNYSAGNTWPLPYSIDWNTLADITEINDVAHVVDGKFFLTPDGIRTAEPGYDRLVAIGDRSWTNYELLVPVTIHSMSGGGGAGVLLRWKGHTDSPVSCSQPKCGWLPLGDIAWYRPNKLEFYEGGNLSRTLTPEVTYLFRTAVETDGSGNTTYRMKVWEEGTTEPAAWDMEKTTGPTDEQEGSFLLIAHQADVTFGKVTVTPGPLTISNIQVQLANNNTEATITWNTNQPATSRVGYGPTSAYESGTVEETNLVNNHSITLTNLSPNTVYHYQISGENAAMETASTGDLIFSTFSSGIKSDDFCDGVLDPVWTFDNPLDDAGYQFTGAGSADAWLEISVPPGTEHQLFTSGILAPNMLQPVNNADFEVEVKFESPVITPQFQQQGILVKESDNKYLRFEFYSKDPGETFLYAQAFDLPNASSAFVNTSIAASGLAPLYMRVRREGNQWTLLYSFDGTDWTTGASFTYALTPNEIGPYAGNAIGNGSPAHTAQIDYFLNLADPFTAEDGCTALLPPVLSTIGDQSLEEGASLTVPVSATDPDGDDSAISFSATGLPSFAQFTDNQDGTATLQINPVSGNAGTYPVTVIATDTDQLTDSETFDILVTVPGTGPANLVSDDFCEGVLGDHWTFVDPLNDGNLQFTGAGSSDAWLELSLPAGPEHQVWESGIQAPHVIQEATDENFTVEIKMESPVNAPQYQMQGILVKQDDFNFLRFEIYSTNANTSALGAILSSPTGTLPLNSDIPVNLTIGALNTAPVYLRVERNGDLWTQSYSFDGENWTVAGFFSHDMTVAGVGIYGGNATGNNAPAHTAQFDYFENLGDPLMEEDDCAGCTTPPCPVTLNGNLTLQGRSDYASGLTVELYEPGTTTPAGTFSANSNAGGDFSVPNVPEGVYDIFVKAGLYLQSALPNQTLEDGGAVLDFGELRAGDADDNNQVEAIDFSILAGTFNLAEGEPGYDGRADFNGDAFISALDFSLLASNFNTSGQEPLFSGMEVSTRNEEPILNQVDLRIRSAEDAVKPGAVFVAELLLEAGAQRVDAVEAHLRFDPGRLEVTDIEWTGALSLVLRESFDNGSGMIDLATGSLTDYTSGEQVIARIRFRAKGKGPAEVVFDEQGLPSDATFLGNSILKSLRGASLQIGQTGIAGSMQVQVFPIPAGDRLQVLVTDPAGSGAVEVRVYNLDGKLLINKPLNEPELMVGQLPSGVYLLEVVCGGAAIHRSRFIRK